MMRRGSSLSVAQRLFFGLLPSLLALALVVGLAYYGEYGRVAPTTVIVGAGVLAVTSLVVTWANARHLSARIARLAGTGEQGTDELDRIESAVAKLGTALAESESARERDREMAVQRHHEHATMIAATVRSTLAQLDEVRLPVHILLDAPFGSLNENQEELLGAARDAADMMDDALRRLAQVADADRGALAVQRTLVQVNDVVRAVLPLAHAAAARHHTRVETSLEPGLPRVLADRARLAEALALLFESVDHGNGERAVVIATARVGQTITVTMTPGTDEPDEKMILAARLIEAQGGRLEPDGDHDVVRFDVVRASPA